MSTLQDFLNYTRSTLITNLNSCADIHFVIGNESCDLDSTISAITLAYFLYKCKSPLVPNTALIVPVLNVSKKNFIIRGENCFVLQKSGISLDSLVYRDEVNFQELLKTKQVTVSVVDHHVLSKNDLILEPLVVQIFDHRPFDERTNWKNKDVKLRIEQVGSCTTLIADEILCKNENLLSEDIAYMMYQAILFDTVGFLPEAARAKELDLTVASKLEQIFHLTESKTVMYQRLWTEHNSVLHLTSKQILLKDLKMVEKVPVPGLPMLVEEFLSRDDSYKAIEEMSVEYKVSVMVLIGLKASEEVKRDVAIYWRDGGENLKNVVLSMLKNSRELKGYDFGFKEVPVKHPNIVCLKQNNIKLSRKQIIPIIIDAVAEDQKLN